MRHHVNPTQTEDTGIVRTPDALVRQKGDRTTEAGRPSEGGGHDHGPPNAATAIVVVTQVLVGNARNPWSIP